MTLICLDGGGTRTLAGRYGPQEQLLAEASAGPCNPIAYGLAASARSLLDAARAVLGEAPAEAAAAAVAGALDPEHRKHLGSTLCQALGLRQAWVATDLHTLLWANAGHAPAVLVIAGTGASVLGQDATGRQERAGGRGTVFGDDGSAYAVAVNALRAAALAVDGAGQSTALCTALPPAAGVANFEDLVEWSCQAGKRDIARLATTVVALAASDDAVALGVLEQQALRLATISTALYSRLRLHEHANSAASPEILVHGGMFSHCSQYLAAFRAYCEAFQIPVVPAGIAGHAAALTLFTLPADHPPAWATCVVAEDAATLPPTEQLDGSDTPLDTLDAPGIVRRMCAAEDEVARALRAAAAELEQAVSLAAQSIRAGGRIIYVGAGTSGRLGVLDASECPPTFGVPPERVVGIIAGGEVALRQSVEGAEDDAAAGAAAVRHLGPNSSDFVVGIAASGTTPYTLGALRAAREAGARTSLLCCNPQARAETDVLVALDTGPEVLAGSTRLKAGSATKAALNLISTGAMSLSGLVYRGMMVGLRPVNEKLRQRAVRMVSATTGAHPDEARTLLEAADWEVRLAMVMAWQAVGPEEARARLRASGGDLRQLARNTK